MIRATCRTACRSSLWNHTCSGPGFKVEEDPVGAEQTADLVAVPKLMEPPYELGCAEAAIAPGPTPNFKALKKKKKEKKYGTRKEEATNRSSRS